MVSGLRGTSVRVHALIDELVARVKLFLQLRRVRHWRSPYQAAHAYNPDIR